MHRIAEDLPGIEIFGKAEYFNPGGSVKDRPAMNMIRTGEAAGLLNPGKIIIDATSGNTGIAYAMIAAASGYRVKLCLPSNASMERKRILQAYGAEIVYTDPAEGSDGAIRKVREIVAADPIATSIPINTTTRQIGRPISKPRLLRLWSKRAGASRTFWLRWVPAGHLSASRSRLHHDMPHVECLSAQPATGFHGLEGLKHMPTAIVPGIYDASLASENLWLETEDAYRMVKRLAREEGVLVGISAGANVDAALQAGQKAACSRQNRGDRDHPLR